MGPTASGYSQWRAALHITAVRPTPCSSVAFCSVRALLPDCGSSAPTIRPLLRLRLRLHLDLGCDLLDHMPALVHGLLLRQARLLSTLS
jgi:hypothetical protein